MAFGGIGRSKLVSQSALASIFEEIEEHGLPKAKSRSSIKRARDESVDIETPYGKLLVSEQAVLTLEEGQEKPEMATFFFVNPLSLIHYICQNCDEYATFFKQMLDRHQPNFDRKLDIVAYNDEVTPGNVLRHVNERKVYIAYWSFKAHGLPALSTESCWFLLGIARSDAVRRLPGKAGQWLKMALCKFYEPYDLRSGIQIVLPTSERRVIFGEVSMLIGDEVALKESLDFRGASGTVLCPLCQNIVDHKSEIHLHDSTGRILPSTNLDPTLVQPHSDKSVRDTLKLLADKKNNASKAAFERAQQLTGWSLNLHGVLLCEQLSIKPVSSICFDWMHTYLSSGLWNHETGLLLSRLSDRCNYTHRNLHDDLQTFRFPSSLSSRSITGQKVFAKKKKDESPEVKCSASEGLSLYSVLRFVLVQKASEFGPVRSEIESYLRLARVMDLLQGIKKGSTHSSVLHKAILDHLHGYLMVYCGERFAPKHHYSSHLGRMHSAHEGLISCFVHERKHKEVKKFATLATNTWIGWEKSVLSDSLCLQLRELRKGEVGPLKVGLLNPDEPSTRLESLLRTACSEHDGEVMVALRGVFSPGAVAGVGDAVLFSCEAERLVGQIQFFARIGAEEFVCIKKWKHLGRNRFEDAGKAMLCPLIAILDTCIYSPQDGYFLVVPLTTWDDA